MGFSRVEVGVEVDGVVVGGVVGVGGVEVDGVVVVVVGGVGGVEGEVGVEVDGVVVGQSKKMEKHA